MTTRETEIRKCRKCEAEFTARKITGVVHCPACREARRTGVAPALKGAAAVAHAHRTCTITVGARGEKCGKRAVFAFTSKITGEVFAECAEHH